jgi:hypothetical protein
LQTAWASGVFLPAWEHPSAYQLNAGVIATTAVSGSTELGFAGVAPSGNVGLWLLPFYGPLSLYNMSGIVNAYVPPNAAIVFTGLGSLSTVPYAVDASGNIYTLAENTTTIDILSLYDVLSTADLFASSGLGTSGLVAIGTFGSPALTLSGQGNKLYTLSATASGIGTATISGTGSGAVVTSSLIATPMPVPSCLAVSGSLIAVGGWGTMTISSGFSALAANPLNNTSFIGATPAVSAISYWQLNGLNGWAETQTLSGIGSLNALAWSSIGNTLLGTDSINNVLSVFNYTFGSLTRSQTLALSGATAVGLTPNATKALACQPSLNTVTSLSLGGSTWALGAPLSIAKASSVFLPTASTAVVGASGALVNLQYTLGAWVIGASTTLSFTPSYLASDSLGNIIAAGTQGANGYLYTQGLTATFSGSVVGLFYQQGQYVIADGTNSRLRVFSLFAGALTEQNDYQGPNSLQALNATSIISPITVATTIIAAGSGATEFFNLSAPYALAANKNGEVSTYNGSGWVTTNLQSYIPTALTFDPSGRITVATLQNELFTISPTGGVIASGVITQFTGQPQATPLGISSLQWINNSLFATSSLNDIVLEII